MRWHPKLDSMAPEYFFMHGKVWENPFNNAWKGKMFEKRHTLRGSKMLLNKFHEKKEQLLYYEHWIVGKRML